MNRLAQQRCLLVLDNLETLLEPTGQWRDQGYYHFFLRWFETGGRSILLITSRERPDLPANQLGHTRSYSIGGLPVEAGVALLRAQQVQGNEPELREYVVAADGHPLLLNLTVGFLKEVAGDHPPISGLQRADLNLLKIVGLHRGDPQTSIEIVLKKSLRRLDETLLAVLFEVWAFPMPFTQKLLKIARDSSVTEAQLRQLAKRSLLQETYRPEGWTFQFQPLIRTYLQQQLLDVYRATNNRLGEANTLQAIGDVLQFLDRRSEALTNYEQAIGLYREVGDRLGEANVLQKFGKLQEDPQAGLGYLQQAQSIYEQIGDQYSQSRNLLFVAACQIRLQKIDAAIATLQHSAALASTIGYEPLQQYALDRITELQQPAPAPRAQLSVFVSRLKGWHYILLGVSALILVLLIQWITHK
ncbi:tetratricopeptide repeat protein [Leptodesmis sp.]|uniref:tetratricopeptide repeat protein n=1 Tax=Leptodesmis sp. TaxID=3100501 RepID=UPI00405348F0